MHTEDLKVKLVNCKLHESHSENSLTEKVIIRSIVLGQLISAIGLHRAYNNSQIFYREMICRHVTA